MQRHNAMLIKGKLRDSKVNAALVAWIGY